MNKLITTSMIFYILLLANYGFGAYVFVTDLENDVSTAGSSATTLVVVDSQTLSGNLTVPANIALEIKKGGSVNRAGYTLAINGPFSAGPYTVFTGNGTTTFGGAIEYGYAEWWGIDGSSGEDGLNNALAALKHVKFTQNITIDGTINITKSHTKLSTDREGLTISTTSTSGNAIYIYSASPPLREIIIEGFKLSPNTPSASNTVTGIYNYNGQRVKLRDMEISNCGSHGFYNNKDLNTVEDCIFWYNEVGIKNDGAGHCFKVVRGLVDNNTTGILLEDAAFIKIDSVVVQSNATGVKVTAESTNCYSPYIHAYFEDNTTDVIVAGTSASHMVYNFKLSGYLNHSAAAAPCVTLAWANMPLIENLAVINIQGNEDFLDVNSGVRGLSLINVSQEAYPYISSQTLVPSFNGLLGTKNLVSDGGFEAWNDQTTLTNWNTYSTTVAQETSDQSEGIYAVAVTATSAGGIIYQDYIIPPAFRRDGVPFLIVADTKVISGSGAAIQAAPLDNSGYIQGLTSTIVSTSGSWQTISARPGYLNAGATKIRIILDPDNTGSEGISLFDRVAVYWGSTPWTF